MAAFDRAAEARDDRIESCQEREDVSTTTHATLSGWRSGIAAAIVAAALLLVATPVVGALDPSLLGQATRLLEGLAGLTPLTIGARALVFVVALVVISRPDGRA
jgi:ABC-type glutathione transport system ATPase component